MTSQPSAVAVQELVDAMGELYSTEEWSDVIIHCTDGDDEMNFHVHSIVVCPRSRKLRAFLQSEPTHDSPDIPQVPYKWSIGEWKFSVVESMLQYLYQLDYDVPRGIAADPFDHAEVWCLAEDLGINGLKVVALGKLKRALTEHLEPTYNCGFTLSYVEDLGTALERLRELAPYPSASLRDQLSTHIQEKVKQWAKVGRLQYNIS